MACIKKRGEFQFRVRVRRKGYPSISATFETRSDAEAWARDVESQMDRKVFVNQKEAERTTLKEALKRYKLEVVPSKKGKDIEEGRIDQLMKHGLAHRSMASLTSADFASYRDERLKVVKPSTVRNELAILSNLFTVANMDWGYNIGNPIINVRKPKVDNARDRRLEGDEEGKLMNSLDKCNNQWVRPISILAIETAMRLSELRSLKWKDINLVNRTAFLKKTKNGDSRTVPLTLRAVALLESLPRHISGTVCPVSNSSVSHSFLNACKRVGIENLHFHDLRHEATSRLAEKLQMHELMKVTGHKTASMLARYYHPRAEDLAKKIG